MSRVGTYGIVSYINSNQEFCLAKHAFIIPKQNSKYLYYFLSSPIAKIQIESFATGSTQKTISLRSIKEIVLSLPDLPTQTRIASILSAIDDKNRTQPPDKPNPRTNG
ncbi:MAG: restriction endonuclease subunit S [Bacteroidetes bacterium]|nr:restriction endonuclease subunit S [Bacteroidota bacterium]